MLGLIFHFFYLHKIGLYRYDILLDENDPMSCKLTKTFDIDEFWRQSTDLTLYGWNIIHQNLLNIWNWPHRW
jgi:hypothetical protein